MTTAEIKAELNAARDAVREYRLCKDKVAAYKQLLMGGKGVSYENDGAVHERDGNPIERAYCRLADYERDFKAATAVMNEKRTAAESIIATVDNQSQREVLERRYIVGQKWEDIAEAMNYSQRRIFQLHGHGLQKIALYFSKDI